MNRTDLIGVLSEKESLPQKISSDIIDMVKE